MPSSAGLSFSYVDLADPAALVRCAFDAHIGFVEAADGELRVIVNGVDATDELRTETAGAAASAIAAVPEVRSALRDRQRAFRQAPAARRRAEHNAEKSVRLPQQARRLPVKVRIAFRKACLHPADAGRKR